MSSELSELEMLLDKAESLAEQTQQEYCMLESDTSRVVVIPERYKVFGVEQDKDTERVWFKFPKIVGDNIDLTTLNLRVNYMNSLEMVDKYLIDDIMEAEDGYITFSWLIDDSVTTKMGSVHFVVQALKATSEGKFEKKWSTTVNKIGQILEGLEVDETIYEQNPSIIEALLQRMDEFETSGGVTQEQIKTAVEEYLKENPVQPGATEEQVQQIEKNRQNIETKLNKNQGKENNGKILGINETGEVVPIDSPSGGGTEIPGKDGREIELQNSGTAIQWRYVGEEEWKDIVQLSDLKGGKGEPGDKGEDGVTPTIGENGNWFLKEEDTGEPSRGENGEGVPAGGITGQVLIKKSNSDYDTEWKTVSSGGGQLPSVSEFVTPEMYGAVGDGITDDYEAFQSMIETRKPILLQNKYYLSKSVSFYSSLFSYTGAELIFDYVVTLAEQGIFAMGIVFNGNNSSPYVQVTADDVLIYKCKFKDFSGNETYKLTETLYIGETGETIHRGILVDSCIFDGSTCNYENGTVGDAQGGIRQIYVRNSSVKIVNCEFKNLSGMEDGDIIHLQSRSISNTNYPYNKQGNLSFPSVPCIVQGNIFHMEKAKSAVKVQCSDVIVENNIVVVRDVADTENKPRYVFRTQCTADVMFSSNLIVLEKTDALKLTYVFGAESTENAKIIDNIIYDYSTGIASVYDELRSSHIIHAMYCRNLMFFGNNMLLRAIHNLMDIEYCSMTFSKNRIECLGEYPETVFYMNKEYTHSASTSDVSENTVLGFEENEIVVSGTRSKILAETSYIGSIRFRKNKIYGNISSFEFSFGAYCPVSFCEIEGIPDIPLTFKTIKGKDFSKISHVLLKDCKLIYADIQKSDLLQIVDCDISSTYQAINLTDVLEVEAEGNYIHNVENRVFRIMKGNPSIKLKNNRFDDANYSNAIESHYNNDGFLRSNVIWYKNNQGTINGINSGTEPDSTMSYELGFPFLKESESKFVFADGKGSWV